MYLISLYFDETTNRTFRHLQNRIYSHTKVDYTIPFHITLCAFYADEKQAIERFESISFQPFDIDFVSLGFLPSSLYCLPIMNDMLYKLHHDIASIYPMEERYKRNHWLSHITLTKHLSKTQLVEAYQSIQHEFVPFTGKVVHIGLAKSSPYETILVR